MRDQRNSWHGVDFPYHSKLDIERYYKRYCETLCSVDDSIGRVLQQLKDMGIYDDTLVIYMGDNGFMFGEHGLIDKRVAYEPSIRVPLLMRCPSLIKGGTTVKQVVANIDIAPTILEAVGLPEPKIAFVMTSDADANLAAVSTLKKRYPAAHIIARAIDPVSGQKLAAAGAENVDALFRLRRDEVAHVLHEAQDGTIHLLHHARGLAHHHPCQALRRGHQDDAVEGDGLHHRQRRIRGWVSWIIACEGHCARS